MSVPKDGMGFGLLGFMTFIVGITPGTLLAWSAVIGLGVGFGELLSTPTDATRAFLDLVVLLFPVMGLVGYIAQSLVALFSWPLFIWGDIGVSHTKRKPLSRLLKAPHNGCLQDAKETLLNLHTRHVLWLNPAKIH